MIFYIMNYLIIIYFLFLFIRINNTFEYDGDDDDGKQLAFDSSKSNSIFNCLATLSYPIIIVE
jgi:hypothetical protein